MEFNAYKKHDIFDFRDVIERYEELENFDRDKEEEQEFSDISALIDEVEGYGHDVDWRGNWYPIIFVNENYWTDYCQSMCEDCGDIPNDLPFYIANHIDWDGVASDIKQDYSEVIFNDETYYYR